MGGEQDTRAYRRAAVLSKDSSKRGAIRFLHSAQTRKLLFPGCIISPSSCAACIINQLLNNQLHV